MSRNVHGFTMYAPSLKEAEKLRTMIIDHLQASARVARQDPDEEDFPEWDIDADVTRFDEAWREDE